MIPEEIGFIIGPNLVGIGFLFVIWDITQAFSRHKEISCVGDRPLSTAASCSYDSRSHMPREAPRQPIEDAIQRLEAGIEDAVRRLEAGIEDAVRRLKAGTEEVVSFCRHHSEDFGRVAGQPRSRVSEPRKELEEVKNAAGPSPKPHPAVSANGGYGLPRTVTEIGATTYPSFTTEAPGSARTASFQTGVESTADREKPRQQLVLPRRPEWEERPFSVAPLSHTPAKPSPSSISLAEVVSIWNSSGPARSLNQEALSSKLGPRWRVRKIYDGQSPTAFFLLEDREGPVGQRLFILPGIGEWFTPQVQALFPCDETVGTSSDLVVDSVEKPASFRDESRVSFEHAELRHLSPDAVARGKVRTRPV